MHRFCSECGQRLNSCSCRLDNAGQIGIDPLNGDLELGLGGGLAIDLNNGDLAVELGNTGMYFDL